MKFAKGEFEISKAYEKSLMNKLDVFLEESKTRKSLLMTMITTHGVKSNAHSGVVQSEVVLDDLFV